MPINVVSITRRDPTLTYELGHKRYTMTYRVVFDSATGDIITAIQSVDPNTSLALPNYGDSFAANSDTDAYAKCIKITGKQVSGARNAYDFVCEYSTRGAPPASPSNPATPWVKAAEWGPFDEIDYTDVVTRGKPADPAGATLDIKNLAGQAYDPAPTRAFTNTLIKVRWFAETVDLDKVETYRNAINSAAFWNFKARRLKFNRYIASPVYEYGQWFGQYDAEIEVNCDPATSNVWKLRVLEAGTKVLRAGELVLPRDGNAKDYYGTALLAADGTQLPKDGAPVYTDWYIEKEAAFASSGLPAVPAHIVKAAD